MNKLKIGIVGCGAIGSSLAQEVARSLGSCATLTALYDIRLDKAQLLSRRLVRSSRLSVNNLDVLIERSDLVIEASSAKAAWQVARASLLKGRKVMIMSVGGIVNHSDELFILAAKKQSRVYLPSGAVAGIDALKACGVAGIKKVVLTTRKNPLAFAGVEYVEKNFKPSSIKKEKVLFQGSASLAVKYFPQNINVAALLGLAGIGMRKTQVRIIADPCVNKNIHEVLIESKAARIITHTENVLHPQNPKTSYLAVLSATAVLRQILQPLKIGT